MNLIPQPSRAVKTGDIHEIIMTDQDAAPGSKVARVAYVAFVEFQNGGILVYGDEVRLGEMRIGELLGYDLSHFPNHMNIVAKGNFVSGEERGIRPGDTMVFRPKPGKAS